MMTLNIQLGLSWTVLSIGFFVFCRYLARPLAAIRPTDKTKPNVSKPYIRTCLTLSKDEHWDRLNLTISCLHSFLITISVIYSFWAYWPDIFNDFINHLTFVTYSTCCFSFGYFWYDLCDILSNKRGSEMLELLLHHVLAIIFFAFNIFRVRNIGYQMFALIAEVNSVFLHARKLLQLYKIPRSNLLVQINMFINVITFIFCRLIMLYIVTKRCYNDRYRIQYDNYIYVMYVLIPIMWIMNPILFYRVIYSDYIKKHKSRKLMS